MTGTAAARSLAELHLAEQLPGRWLHVSGVARSAQRIGWLLNMSGDDLIAAAWLHDIGYGPDVDQSGFHPLDGARFLRSAGCNEEICRLVAHHSAALVEAELRGLAAELRREFPEPDREVSDALWYCDMITGPMGERVTVDERLDEIRHRYGPGDVVTRFVDLAERSLVAAVRRTEKRLELAQLPS